ncbi:MAG: carbohydrate binding domain-containing protein [Oscillospiraceae bacterium]|nr:carbohydrate binding domain-containing protein [Oscillospiraceae bacterium]
MFNIFKKKQPDAAELETVRREAILDYSYDQSRVLYENNFEDGLKGWEPRGPVKEHFKKYNYAVGVELTEDTPHSGSRCLKVFGRNEDWNGAVLDITDYTDDKIISYEVLVWVRLESDAEPCMLHLSLQTLSKIANIDFPEYRRLDDYTKSAPFILANYRLPTTAAASADEQWKVNYQPGYSTEDGWVLLRGKMKLRKSHYDKIFLYIETSEGKINTQDLFIDDFVLLEGE